MVVYVKTLLEDENVIFTQTLVKKQIWATCSCGVNVAELNREQNASQERVRTKHHEAAPWSICGTTEFQHQQEKRMQGLKTTQHPWYLTEHTQTLNTVRVVVSGQVWSENGKIWQNRMQIIPCGRSASVCWRNIASETTANNMKINFSQKEVVHSQNETSVFFTHPLYDLISSVRVSKLILPYHFTWMCMSV